jgi:RimJ/RimL family protein N-acetyltransferase
MTGHGTADDGVPASGRVTRRLRLVPAGPALAEDLLVLHHDPGVARWYGGAWDEARVRRYAELAGRAWATEGVHKWLAYNRADNTLIGRGGLAYKEVDGARRLEVGWALRERFWGQGYATEIGAAGLSMAFGELAATEVVSFTEPHNRRSRAVMERLGFVFQREIRYEGEPFVLYALTAEQAAG